MFVNISVSNGSSSSSYETKTWMFSCKNSAARKSYPVLFEVDAVEAVWTKSTLRIRLVIIVNTPCIEDAVRNIKQMEDIGQQKEQGEELGHLLLNKVVNVQKNSPKYSNREGDRQLLGQTCSSLW